MSNTVIKVENLYKEYRLGIIGTGTLRRDFQSWWARLRGKEDPNSLITYDSSKGSAKEIKDNILALNDISFEVKQGEILGIIGRNGAGKSTLLKILSRITSPTRGEVKIRGRIASLLEVGTGFHPELTGKENIYLNGTILGMKKKEIDKKLDEIVKFAEIEKFMDTPVKRYSSGMYVRLAFAVAAHLEPEILLVDEVLAVGDAQFQKKCLGKMKDIGKEGRTILFVSHNMPMITALCPRALLLNAGIVEAMGNTSDVILTYYKSGTNSPVSFYYSKENKKIGDEYVALIAGSVRNSQGEITTEVDINHPLSIFMHFRVLKESGYKFIPNFHFFTADGTYAFVSSQDGITKSEPGDYCCECHIPPNFLNDGAYFVGLAVSSFESGVKVHFYEKDILSFNIKDNIEQRVVDYSGPIPGVVRPKLEWRLYGKV